MDGSSACSWSPNATGGDVAVVVLPDLTYGAVEQLGGDVRRGSQVGDIVWIIGHPRTGRLERDGGRYPALSITTALASSGF
ncbi:hypothetical protein [Rhodococcus sp. IEGM 1379]|uniref:hypothetical protein n=1 Tax=Rhodococcus sp. IEGM 1379 TaxID=3047086 RepID=UPI0024B818F7|nr:hypothetical protein [Rhodococcus sp. IEGM 1379]MDI9916719.1 hypothetical protein [Rhodococcus sp. IEGM 1379]